jgi:ABC-type antimicrobial peptide transport system permease subunit
LIASLLYGIGPRDPRALALAAAALVAVAVAAAIVPIRRATGVDPVYALRLE